MHWMFRCTAGHVNQENSPSIKVFGGFPIGVAVRKLPCISTDPGCYVLCPHKRGVTKGAGRPADRRLLGEVRRRRRANTAVCAHWRSLTFGQAVHLADDSAIEGAR